MVFSQRSLRQSQTIIQLNTLFRWPQINLFEYFGFQTIENFLIIYKKVGKVSLFSLPILNSLNLREKYLLFLMLKYVPSFELFELSCQKNVSFSKPKNAPILKVISIFTKKKSFLGNTYCFMHFIVAWNSGFSIPRI